MERSNMKPWMRYCIPVALMLPAIAVAGPVKSGNELALDFTMAGKRLRNEIQADAAGKLYFFRYLRIVGIEKDNPSKPRVIRMSTVEPGSDMIVNFTVRKKHSLRRSSGLNVGEAVAVTGRISGIDAVSNSIALGPVIVRYKDRLSPKRGKELLYEVDPAARRGQTTTKDGATDIK
jgi:hypothetical protein